jgi:iron complex outermembrane receptor protein
VGGFYSLYENLISYEYYPPLFARPYNFDTAAVGGLEAEGELQPRPWAGGTLGYTLMFSQNLRDDPRYYLKELPYRPRHKLYARVTGGPLWARARAEVVYQSEQYINRTQTVALPPRAFLSAGVSTQVGSSPQVVASLELKNALDTHAEDFDGYPLPGRALYLTVSVAWDRRPDDASLSHAIK